MQKRWNLLLLQSATLELMVLEKLRDPIEIEESYKSEDDQK